MCSVSSSPDSLPASSYSPSPPATPGPRPKPSHSNFYTAQPLVSALQFTNPWRIAPPPETPASVPAPPALSQTSPLTARFLVSAEHGRNRVVR